MSVAALTDDLRSRMLDRMAGEPTAVWTPGDFADLAGRAAIDKTLQRLEALGEVRRIDRGLYHRSTTNSLTAQPTVPDYRAVVRAVARRDKVRFVVSGVTAANELGLTTAVPTHIEVMVDARLKPIRLGNQQIFFKSAIFADPKHGQAIRDDLREGLSALQIWMQELLRNLISPARGERLRERRRLSAGQRRLSQQLPRSLRVHHHPRARR